MIMENMAIRSFEDRYIMNKKRILLHLCKSFRTNSNTTTVKFGRAQIVAQRRLHVEFRNAIETLYTSLGTRNEKAETETTRTTELHKQMELRLNSQLAFKVN